MDVTIQNCDLPPPSKVFIGSNNKTVASSMLGVIWETELSFNNNDNYNYNYNSTSNCETLEILKALRLSQTRAREAEKRVGALEKERDRLSEALIDEAKILFAHRLWFRLLDLQVSSLKARRVDDDDGDDDGGVCSVSCLLALAISCAAFAFGCKYIF